MVPLLIAGFVAVLMFSGCAALDEASVARTDRLKPEQFYKSYRKSAATEEPALLLSVMTDDETADRLKHLRAAIDAYLYGQACCLELEPENALPTAGAPVVYVGSSEGGSAPMEAWDVREEHDKYPPMIVHFAKPSPVWKEALRITADAAGASRVVVTRLGIVQYPKADDGIFGKKVVLGTHHENRVRVLSAIDKPIEVLQLAGVVLDANGSELCAGAEGIVGNDAPFWVQVLEAGKDIDDELIAHVLTTERRDDVPGAPLNWQVAADQLLWNLLHRCS